MAVPVDIGTVSTAQDAAESPTRRRRRRQPGSNRPASRGRKPSFGLFLTIVPFLVLIFLFSYLPLYGWVYSLFDYRPARGLFGSEFVGLQWFRMLVGSPTQVEQIMQVMLKPWR